MKMKTNTQKVNFGKKYKIKEIQFHYLALYRMKNLQLKLKSLMKVCMSTIEINSFQQKDTNKKVKKFGCQDH